VNLVSPLSLIRSSVSLIASLPIAQRGCLTGGRLSVAKASSTPVLPEKGGGGVFLRKMSPIVLMQLVLFGGYLVFLVRFCALLSRISGPRLPSSRDFAFWTTALIVRFWGVILGSAGHIFLVALVVCFVGCCDGRVVLGA